MDSRTEAGVPSTGASLPWALELAAGAQRRTVWTDGTTSVLRVAEESSLAALKWDELLESAP